MTTHDNEIAQERDIQAIVNDILAGTPCDEHDVKIWWDVDGPAWRSFADSGPLEFDEWSDGDDHDGCNVGDFFGGQDGEYLGPDADGIYPVLEV